MTTTKLCEAHSLPTGKRGTCKTCREERSKELARQREVREMAREVYEARADRRVHPEGTFDSAGRWYPSDDEDHGMSWTIRSPSRNWPYSYMTACRTLRHCVTLVEAAMAGETVPADVRRVVGVAS